MVNGTKRDIVELRGVNFAHLSHDKGHSLEQLKVWPKFQNEKDPTHPFF